MPQKTKMRLLQLSGGLASNNAAAFEFVDGSGASDQSYLRFDTVSGQSEFGAPVVIGTDGATAGDIKLTTDNNGEIIWEGSSADGNENKLRAEDGAGVNTLPASTGTILTTATAVTVEQGGTGATSLTDGGILLGNGSGAIQAMNVLSDGEMLVGDGTTDPAVESGATLRTSIGVGTGDSPQFTGIELGHASDTTLTRQGSGDVNIEGNIIYRAGGTDVAIADGGTGASTAAAAASALGVGTEDSPQFTGLNLESSTSNLPLAILKNTNSDALGARLRFVKDKGAAGADGDDVGSIEWLGDDAGQNATAFGKILVEVSESDDTDEAGKMSLFVAESNGTTTTLTAGLILEGEHATDGQVDVTIGAGSASTTTIVGEAIIAGDLTVQGTTTTVNQTIIESTVDVLVFEGATANAHETTLKVVEPTADCSFALPTLTAGNYFIPAITDTATDASTAVTAAEFALLDGDSNVATVTVADNDGVLFNDAGTMKQVTVQSLAAYYDDEITAMPNLVTIGKAAATTDIAAGDLTMYNAVNDGNPTIRVGKDAADSLGIAVSYASGAQTLEKVEFSTASSTGNADDGKFVFDVDGTDILSIGDAGVSISASMAYAVAGTAILSDSGGTMTLSNVDAIDATTESTIEAAIDSLVELTTIGKAAATTNIAAGDVTMYNAVNDGNPSIRVGKDAADSLGITVSYASGAQTLEKVEFATASSTANADDGRFIFDVDGTDIVTIGDAGLELKDDATIGSLSDHDLLTLGNAILTVAGEVSMTTLDIGGTNVTATATELSLLDGDVGNDASITIADTDGILVDDGGAMKKVPASDLKTFIGSGQTTKGYTEVGTAVAADANVSVPTINAASWGQADISAATDREIYLNGQLLMPGASAASNKDWYNEGTTNGIVRFEFGLEVGDVLTFVLRS